MAGPAFTSDREVIASLESFIDDSGEFDDLLQDSDTQQTRTEEKPPVEDKLRGQEDEPPVENPGEDERDEEHDHSREEDTEDTEEIKASEGDEGDAPDISTLDSLANYFDVEPDEVLESIQVEDPFGNSVSIGDALNGWRESEQKISERQTNLENEFSEARAKYDEEANAAVQQLALFTKTMIEEIQTQYTPERLQYLRESDPDQYLQMMERKHALDSRIGNSIQIIEQESARQHQHAEKERADVLQREHQALLQKLPEWRDEKTRSDAMGTATQYLKNVIGFTDDDINSIYDHRLMLILRDAVTGHQLRQGGDQKKVSDLKRKGLKRPTLRGQTRRDPENPKTRERQDARARLRQSGSTKDAASLIEGLIE